MSATMTDTVGRRATTIDSPCLEVAGRGRRSCGRCYVSLEGTHMDGWMTFEDWREITDAAGLGVRRLLLVGGEPTSNPALPDLVDHSLAAGVEVVQIATSICGHPAPHRPASRGAGVRAQTLTNLVEAWSRGITLHVGLVCLGAGDDDTARRLPDNLSVSQIDRDRRHGVGHGRGVSSGCGRRGLRRATVLADGRATPCVRGRGDTSGNVRDTPLGELLAGQRWSDVVAAARTKTSSGGRV